MELTTDCKMVLLTHTDLDGYGPEIVLRSVGFNPTVVNLENTMVDSYIEKYVISILEGETPAPDVLFITDIAPNEAVGDLVDVLHQSGKTHVRLFDHHPTALGLNQYAWATVIVEEEGVKPCGTSLLYSFIEEQIYIEEETLDLLDALVKEIQLYDTWVWKKENHVSAKILNDLFWLVGHEAFVENQIRKIQQGDETLFSEEEQKLLAVENRRIKKYLNDKKEDMIILDDFFTDGEGKPLVAGVVQADTYFSELGHFLCNEHPEIDFAILLNLTHDKASLRAVKEEVNLVPVVKRYGGGGHPPAAGCQITPMGIEFMQKVFEKIAER